MKGMYGRQQLSAGEKLPVIPWIYGAGFTGGAILADYPHPSWRREGSH